MILYWDFINLINILLELHKKLVIDKVYRVIILQDENWLLKVVQYHLVLFFLYDSCINVFKVLLVYIILSPIVQGCDNCAKNYVFSPIFGKNA